MHGARRWRCHKSVEAMREEGDAGDRLGSPRGGDSARATRRDLHDGGTEPSSNRCMALVLKEREANAAERRTWRIGGASQRE